MWMLYQTAQVDFFPDARFSVAHLSKAKDPIVEELQSVDCPDNEIIDRLLSSSSDDLHIVQTRSLPYLNSNAPRVQRLRWTGAIISEDCTDRSFL